MFILEGARAARRGADPLHVVSGLTAGTPVMTAEGLLPVDYLQPGDRIVTRNGGMVQLDSVTATCACHRGIRIGAGALGRNAPATELVLPQHQPILLRGGLAQEFRGQDQALVPAIALLDLPGVEDEGSCELRLFRPVFDRPRIVYAGGLELGFGPEAAAIRPAA